MIQISPAEQFPYRQPGSTFSKPGRMARRGSRWHQDHFAPLTAIKAQAEAGRAAGADDPRSRSWARNLPDGRSAPVVQPTRRGQAMATYGKKASEKVEKMMHERKEGTLRSNSGQKVTSRKQAIAIGLSEARKAGGKVPAKKSTS
ncbi:MAG: DUF6496 domain-containing protein [Caldimonas sp.]